MPGSRWIENLDTNYIVGRYLAGESINQIAHDLSLSRGVIRLRLTLSGVDIRGKTEVNRLMAASRTPEQHKAFAFAAQETRRGQKDSESTRRLRALNRESTKCYTGCGETILLGWLTARGITGIHQQAIGPYNLDIGCLPIAVEVHGKPAYPATIKCLAVRSDYLRNLGWSIMYVWVTKGSPLSEGAADAIAAWHDELRGRQLARGEYKVIRGNGKDATR